jgi:predicted hotdog family 3-hydroxylacyl-ACP dehydratase
VSGGAGAWAPAAGGRAATFREPVPTEIETGAGEPPEAAALLPHRGPALLARRVVDRDAAGLVCEGAIPVTSPLAEGGRAPAFAALELAAQAAGLHEILLAGESGAAAPQIGYLVRVREAVFGGDLPVATPVVVRVDRKGGAPPLTLYRLETTLAGAEIARGTLATYAVPPAR